MAVECLVLGLLTRSEIFEGGFLANHPSLAFGHMQVRVDSDASGAEEQLTYLYK